MPTTPIVKIEPDEQKQDQPQVETEVAETAEVQQPSEAEVAEMELRGFKLVDGAWRPSTKVVPAA